MRRRGLLPSVCDVSGMDFRASLADRLPRLWWGWGQWPGTLWGPRVRINQGLPMTPRRQMPRIPADRERYRWGRPRAASGRPSDGSSCMERVGREDGILCPPGPRRARAIFGCPARRSGILFNKSAVRTICREVKDTGPAPGTCSLSQGSAAALNSATEFRLTPASLFVAFQGPFQARL